MKRVLLATMAITFVATAGMQNAAAQSGDNQMSIRVAGYEVLLKGSEPHRNEQRRRTYYSGRLGALEIGFNDFRTWGDTYSAYEPSEYGFMELDVARSVHATVNLSTMSTGLVRGGWLGISMAIGVTYNQYVLDTPVAFEKFERTLYPVAVDHPLKRSKLRTLALHVPLLVEICPSRNFFISAGGYADLVLWSSAKWKHPKQKLTSPGVDFFQAGLTARIGFRDVYIFGNYAVSELFKPGRGPRLNPYTFGLGFGF